MGQKKQDRNYAQFYALLKQLEGANKEDLVDQYTGGRTCSLRAMSELEYRSMIGAMQRITTNREELRQHRSSALHLMQLLGINTANWDEVNGFCNLPQIARKPFSKISVPELRALCIKLRAMQAKGYRYKHRKAQAVVYCTSPSTTSPS